MFAGSEKNVAERSRFGRRTARVATEDALTRLSILRERARRSGATSRRSRLREPSDRPSTDFVRRIYSERCGSRVMLANTFPSSSHRITSRPCGFRRGSSNSKTTLRPSIRIWGNGPGFLSIAVCRAMILHQCKSLATLPRQLDKRVRMVSRTSRARFPPRSCASWSRSWPRWRPSPSPAGRWRSAWR